MTHEQAQLIEQLQRRIEQLRNGLTLIELALHRLQELA